MNKKISVIVPAYNAQETIERCVLSIKNQSYSNIEIIVVNDGSSDETEKIVQRIADRDSKVRLITIPNGGVSHARNVGIDNATGDFITFVDSDDYIDYEMYAYLMDLVPKYDADIAQCSYKNINPDGSIVLVGNNEKIIEQSRDEAVKCLISGRLFSGGLWNKVYRATLFENIRLDEHIKYNEDVLANFYLFEKANKSVYSDIAFYNYVANHDSSTHSADPVRANREFLYVAEKILNKSIGKPYEEVARRRMLNSLLGLYAAYLFADKNRNSKKQKQEIKSRIVENYKKGLYKSKKDRVRVFMFRFFPHIYVGAYRLYDKIRVKKLDPEQ